MISENLWISPCVGILSGNENVTIELPPKKPLEQVSDVIRLKHQPYRTEES
jgi:hypothetical protein